MTKVLLLHHLKKFTEQLFADTRLPVKRQERDTAEPEPRAPDVWLMRLPDMSSVTKTAPYIIHIAVNGADKIANSNQGSGNFRRPEPRSRALIRSVFCVYDPDAQEGALSLLDMMEDFRIALEKQNTLGQFRLDWDQGIEDLVYPIGTERELVPYFIGEVLSTWLLPPVYPNAVERMLSGADPAVQPPPPMPPLPKS